MAKIFTPEARISLMAGFAAGLTLPDAAQDAGLKEATVKGWLTRGRKEAEGPYHEFAAIADLVRHAAEPEPMDPDEHRLVVSTAARAGSVNAMKLYWEILQRDEQRDDEDETDAPQGFEALDADDEVAQQRARRAAAT